MVRALMVAAAPLTSGGRRLDAEDLAALKRGSARLALLVYSVDAEDGEVIDLATERARRR